MTNTVIAAAQVRLKELPAILMTNYFAGTNTFLRGKPALGKTSVITATALKIAKRLSDHDGSDFKLYQFYVPTMSPIDIQASAPDNTTGKLRMYNNEALPNAYDNPDLKGIVFLGELPNADPETAKLLQKYVNGEDMSGVLRKPDGIVVVADGNRLEDKSGVNQQYRAMLSRFEQINVYAEPQDNLEYAAKNDWHPLVQAFMDRNPTLIDNYDEVFHPQKQATDESRAGVWANMRSWERISKKETAATMLSRTLSIAEVQGNVGQGVAAQYTAFKELLLDVATFEQIIANPTGVAIPERMDKRYAMASVTAHRAEKADMDAVFDFAKRMSYEFQAVMLRILSTRTSKGFATTKGYMRWMSDPELCAMIAGTHS